MYVIKELEIDGMRNDERWKRELRALTSLDHPHIVRYFSSWIEMNGQERRLKIQLQHCGSSMSRMYYSRGIPLPPREAWRLMTDVLKALCFMHEMGVVHHDLKPCNICCMADHREGSIYRVIDLGMCDEPDKCTECGDGKYVPPEVLRGIVSFKADIYSLGATVWQLLTVAQVPSDISQRQFPMDSVPQPLQSLLESMLSRSVDSRPSARSLLDEMAWIDPDFDTNYELPPMDPPLPCPIVPNSAAPVVDLAFAACRPTPVHPLRSPRSFTSPKARPASSPSSPIITSLQDNSDVEIRTLGDLPLLLTVTSGRKIEGSRRSAFQSRNLLSSPRT